MSSEEVVESPLACDEKNWLADLKDENSRETSPPLKQPVMLRRRLHSSCRLLRFSSDFLTLSSLSQQLQSLRLLTASQREILVAIIATASVNACQSFVVLSRSPVQLDASQLHMIYDLAWIIRSTGGHVLINFISCMNL